MNKHTDLSSYLIEPNQVQCLNRYLVGGKALELARLRRYEYLVPNYLVLSSKAYQHTLDDIEKHNPLTRDRKPNFYHTSQQCRSTITNTLEIAIKKIQAGGSRLIAVRSSAVEEDGETQAYAGLMKTILGVQTLDDLFDAVVQIWSSYHSAELIAYREKLNANSDSRSSISNAGCAVIIQEMIQPQASGVLFTAHPQSGQRDCALVEANYGLGESVVQPEGEIDQYLLDLATSGHNNPIEQKIGTKETARRYDASKRKVISKPIREQFKRIPCLSSKQLGLLHSLAVRMLKTHEREGPQDCEWAFVKNKLYLLQARPITRLPLLQKPLAEPTIWDNSNIQESYNGVTTPLTFSVASLAYATVYEETARIAGAPEKLITRAKPLFRNLIGYVHGHIYYNINNWIECLSYAPSFKRSKEDMEKMMGVSTPIPFLKDENFRWQEKLKKLPLVLLAAYKLVTSMMRLKKNILFFLKEAERLMEKSKAKNLNTQTDFTLIRSFSALNEDMLSIWHIPIHNDVYVMIMNGLVGRTLNKLVGTTDNDNEQDAVVKGAELESLLAVDKELASIAPALALNNIAKLISNSAEARYFFSEYKKKNNQAAESNISFSMESLYALMPQIEPVCRLYLNKFGDRFIGEQKLETITPIQNPDLLIPLIANCLDDNGILNIRTISNTRHQEIQEKLDEKLKQYTSTIKGKFLCHFLKFTLKRLRNGIDQREAMRLERTRLFGQYRAIFFALGKQWSQAGLIEKPGDIFFITWEEIFAYTEGRGISTDFKSLVSIRRIEYLKRKALPPLKQQFTTYGGISDLLESDMIDKPYNPNQKSFQGTGCQAGMIRGKVKVLLSADQNLDIKDAVLCARRTDPGWTPLFLGAKAVIVEQGTLLSHSAIIARELGIPTIINVPHITQILKDGDCVEIDGQSGRILLVEDSDDDKKMAQGASTKTSRVQNSKKKVECST